MDQRRLISLPTNFKPEMDVDMTLFLTPNVGWDQSALALRLRLRSCPLFRPSDCDSYDCHHGVARGWPEEYDHTTGLLMLTRCGCSIPFESYL